MLAKSPPRLLWPSAACPSIALPIRSKPSIALLATHRHASTSTPTTTAAAAATTHTPPSSSSSSASSTATTAAADGPLDWDEFLAMRKQKRRYNLVSSIFTAGVGTVTGVSYFANKEIDVTQMIMGMDPLVVFGAATLGCGAVGWLAGPVLGTSAFSIVKRKYMARIVEREREFLQHIRKNRVDPSFQSVTNPVPDYYGEKIGSVRQYRQWLKDQRAYNRKREKFL